MRILFAEDSRSTALPIISFLQERGHEVVHVVDGKAALEAFAATRPDLVLLDVVMPVMDGIEATRRIKALGVGRWVPVMLMTSLAAKEEIVAGLDAGADDYLIKPIVFEVLEARIRSMQRIATIQDSLAAIHDNVFEAIISIDEAGRVLSYNKAALRIFGYRAEEVVGANVKMLMPSPYTEEHDGYLARYRSERKPHIVGNSRKVHGRRKNGEIFPMQLAVTEVRRNQGSLFIGLISDITREEEARQRIEFLAWHDSLTGLPNRANFNDALEALCKEADGRLHAVLFVDLDGFKPINDTLGHDAGDEALRVIAGRLRNELASTDFVARLGGDEFVAIARDLPGPEAATAIAERLLDSICRPMTLLGKPSRLCASIGIALVPDHGTSADAILTAADNAMYAAKRAGRSRAIMAGTAP
jgi:diguanylate cyclase (GGDEF)-like protein/PAS domain S-box-containing protein